MFSKARGARDPSIAITDGALQRGHACLTCRRRKLKCDGARPICQQCIRYHLQDDCEYAHSQGRTRTQMLEDEVGRLQALIQELENPALTAGNVALHDPYMPASARDHGSGAAPSSRGDIPWWELDHPPRQIADMLTQRFLPHAQQLGFSLNIPRFVASINAAPGDPARPHPALLNAVFLWSVHLSQSEQSDVQVQFLLSRAIAGFTDALGSAEPQKHIQALQAEVLLALYFFCVGRFLEGKYHANAAVSLALSCGLNRIRSGELSDNAQVPVISSTTPLGGGVLGTSSAFNMAPARDMVEEGERINTFWAVFNFDRCWSVATGSQTMLYDDTNLGIDTPWPLAMEAYEQMNQHINATFSHTVQRFLTGELDQSTQNEVSGVALRAKASALFHEATRLASAWSPVNPQAGIPEMRRLHQLITRFLRSLIPLQDAESRSEELGLQMLTVYTLVHGSMTQLHSVRAEMDADAANVCMVHASEIIRLINHTAVDFDFGGKLDFIVGIVWVAAGRVFTRERDNTRNMLMNANTIARKTSCDTSITRIVTALSTFTACPVIRLRTEIIQEALHARG